MATTELSKLYHSYFGVQPENCLELKSSGSNRRYFRLSGKQQAIGVCGTSLEENNAFLYMASHFKKKGIPVPEVYNHSENRLFYLQEDLGDLSLFDRIEKGRTSGTYDKEEQQLLYKTISLLPSIQITGSEGFDFSKCYPYGNFDERAIMWDLNYFKYCFLKTTRINFQENLLEDDFQALCKVLLLEPATTFLYRDFQARNVMLKEGESFFIDFQGGRKGPLAYDLVSFLWQAKARYPNELRNALLTGYIESLQKQIKIDEIHFRSQLPHFVLFRTLQVLGAYGFRGYFEKKTHFIESIPFSIENLKELLQEEYAEYPYLCKILRELTKLNQFSGDKKTNSGSENY